MVAEPATVQGRQIADALNRAISGAEWSGCTSPLHVVTSANISYDGGDKNIFDPGYGYSDAYAKIWNKI